MKFLILNGPNVNLQRYSEPGLPGELDAEQMALVFRREGQRPPAQHEMARCGILGRQQQGRTCRHQFEIGQ